MENNFYTQLKEKAGVLANILAVISIVISVMIYLYSKTFAYEDLIVSYNSLVAPKIPYNESSTKNSRSDTVNFEKCYLITDFFLQNISDNRIRNIEIPLTGFFSDESNINKGYFFSNDTLHYFINKQYLKISDLAPSNATHVVVYSQQINLDNNLFVITENKSYKARPTIEFITVNNFDTWITTLVVSNQFVQILIYILTLIGCYFFIRIVIPFMINIIPNRR